MVPTKLTQRTSLAARMQESPKTKIILLTDMFCKMIDANKKYKLNQNEKVWNLNWM